MSDEKFKEARKIEELLNTKMGKELLYVMGTMFKVYHIAQMTIVNELKCRLTESDLKVLQDILRGVAVSSYTIEALVKDVKRGIIPWLKRCKIDDTEFTPTIEPVSEAQEGDTDGV